jgi:hypothetical protein
MAWIKTVTDSEAQGEVKELYAHLKKVPAFGGRVPNVISSMSLRPKASRRSITWAVPSALAAPPWGVCAKR